jgi:hypothetical protein
VTAHLNNITGIGHELAQRRVGCGLTDIDVFDCVSCEDLQGVGFSAEESRSSRENTKNIKHLQ